MLLEKYRRLLLLHHLLVKLKKSFAVSQKTIWAYCFGGNSIDTARQAATPFNLSLCHHNGHGRHVHMTILKLHQMPLPLAARDGKDTIRSVHMRFELEKIIRDVMAQLLSLIYAAQGVSKKPIVGHVTADVLVRWGAVEIFLDIVVAARPARLRFRIMIPLRSRVLPAT